MGQKRTCEENVYCEEFVMRRRHLQTKGLSDERGFGQNILERKNASGKTKFGRKMALDEMMIGRKRESDKTPVYETKFVDATLSGDGTRYENRTELTTCDSDAIFLGLTNLRDHERLCDPNVSDGTKGDQTKADKSRR